MSNESEANPSWQATANLARLRQRAEALRKIRDFFFNKKVMEVETPSLAKSSALEAEIEQFQIPLSSGQVAWLIPSPELHMKRLLANHSGPIYQICKAFRKNEEGDQHNPEFTLLEYYRPGWNDRQLMAEVLELINDLAPQKAPQEHRYGDLFLEQLGQDAWGLTLKTFQSLCLHHNLSPPNDLLEEDAPMQARRDFLFAFLIEPTLGQGFPQFVTHYPKETASLAKLDPDEPHLARRFELYLNGLEICNGFWELTDGAEQRNRFAEVQNHKRDNSSMDENFLAAMDAGLPESAGVAIGLERLFAALWGGKTKDWISFNWFNC